jgi:hypothetical protein
MLAFCTHRSSILRFGKRAGNIATASCLSALRQRPNGNGRRGVRPESGCFGRWGFKISDPFAAAHHPMAGPEKPLLPIFFIPETTRGYVRCREWMLMQP